MAGLVPAIHVFFCAVGVRVDGRDKPGHDGESVALFSPHTFLPRCCLPGRWSTQGESDPLRRRFAGAISPFQGEGWNPMDDALPAGERLPPGTPPIVVLKGITKTFPGVVANADVDLDVRRARSMRCSARTAPANRR